MHIEREAMTMIRVHQGDITKLKVDAIVNAASESLLGGGGVDGAIHRAAGPQLKEYNHTHGGCLTGEARLSPGFNLPAKWVISTVGPVWRGGEESEPELLESCYRSCFELALENAVRSIAFPAISTGVYGYPKEEATRIAVRVMREFESRFGEIVACCFSEADVEVYQRVLEE
jgi:O-acetyl-ADP-ribose deacetylase (regulator of RNase III)